MDDITLINTFKKSKDYSIIYHMINIVHDDEIIIDVIKRLGYSVVFLLNKNKSKKKDVIVNKNYILLQLTDNINIINGSRYAIFNKKNFR